MVRPANGRLKAPNRLHVLIVEFKEVMKPYEVEDFFEIGRDLGDDHFARGKFLSGSDLGCQKRFQARA